MTPEEFKQKFGTPEWHPYLNEWLRNRLLKIFEKHKGSPEAVQKFRDSYEEEAAKDPNFALQLFWEWWSRDGKGVDPEDILDPSEPVGDEDIITPPPVPQRGILDFLRIWQNARTTADRIRAVEGVKVKDLRDFDPRHLERAKGHQSLPATFLRALVDYGSPEVSRMANRFLANAPTGKELTMRLPQALKFLRNQGIPVDNLSETTETTLDVIMAGLDTMWELDFKNKKAKFGELDRAGKFKPLKSFVLSDGFIHKLAPFWKKNQ